MRFSALVLAGALCGCVVAGQTTTATTTLAAADAATALAAGQQITMTTITPIGDNRSGEDPLIIMQLRNADGRVMSFDESNHAPMHVMAQAPGGPLAQIMGLFGDEQPKLYGARAEENRGAPFICAPDGPLHLGLYEGPDGAVQIVGLRQGIEFETRPDGVTAALPYSPDQVCARLNFRRVGP